MRIRQRTVRDAMVLDMSDEFTYGSRKDFSAPVDKARQAGCRHLILNMTDVTFVDSAAIGLLALTAQQFKIEEKQFSLVGPQGTVKQVLELSNISRLIPVYSTEDAAVKRLAA
jgi:anti-anti-sigma factor